ncbi:MULTISPECIES: hypothetical protein [unclassified Bradyrhizobium]|uniref:hypothetical protein n=1 Tax=unclassified Bradyrhizobium TaxID=2631580 RepID=UPI001CD2A468|nr:MULTISPECIES: hypothetical protein [unclassified Bradyrhizobium]MCA1373298.1 hypothetical protein [Bradyrhizobium sp. IC4060]MCA1484559.1 hypothetical protein [Bradyrhizobium sp. IC4061]MCA1542132.1 hypothetical protein [Bradyrhizobium sp. NBAIM32]
MDNVTAANYSLRCSWSPSLQTTSVIILPPSPQVVILLSGGSKRWNWTWSRRQLLATNLIRLLRWLSVANQTPGAPLAAAGRGQAMRRTPCLALPDGQNTPMQVKWRECKYSD